MSTVSPELPPELPMPTLLTAGPNTNVATRRHVAAVTRVPQSGASAPPTAASQGGKQPPALCPVAETRSH